MLISFTVENYRSIRDEQSFSMEPGRSEKLDERLIADDSDQVLPVAAIYGANASGKSNVLGALAFMRDAVVHSHRLYAPDGGVPHKPFAWGLKAAEPSFFEIVFRIGGVRYEYGFVANRLAFVEEWLHAYPSSRKQIWFERDKDEFKFGEHLKGENRVVEKVTRPNSLFLSAAAQNHHEQLDPIFRWFRSVRAQNVPHDGRTQEGLRRLRSEDQFVKWWSQSSRNQLSMFEDDSGEEKNTRSERFRELLRAADFGIVDLKVTGSANEDAATGGPLRVMVKHQSTVPDAWLPLDEESHGTKQLFRLAPSVLDALVRGSVVLIDELEASLHPLLALQLVRTFNDPTQNKRNAQLVFTTHDTNLLGTILGTPPLRRDQVWLTEKDREGASKLYPLTDYRPRKVENLERGYLQGRYGGIPFLENMTTGKTKG